MQVEQTNNNDNTNGNDINFKADIKGIKKKSNKKKFFF